MVVVPLLTVRVVFFSNRTGADWVADRLLVPTSFTVNPELLSLRMARLLLPVREMVTLVSVTVLLDGSYFTVPDAMLLPVTFW